ncbi:WhiB family transcriptional regulator [Nonomuraea sp. NPDC050536]|uniref:WhiB family transcriptional regulator n=1 Tax=Nonomuraea sp. NPDC050536 TaxID=3364366 RepID=UPI0037C7599D
MPDWKWHERAACKGQPLRLMFGPDGERLPDRIIREDIVNQQFCSHCPVRMRCLEYAFDTKQAAGVWGGLGEDERAAKRRNWLKRTARERAATGVA